VWFLVLRRQSSARVNRVVPAIAILVGLSSFAPFSLQVVAALLVVAVVIVVAGRDDFRDTLLTVGAEARVRPHGSSGEKSPRRSEPKRREERG
jgi:hypothetical protein